MAKQMMDIGLDANGDLLAVDGDWAVLESTEAHKESLILDNKGDYKFAPMVGVGGINYLDTDRPQDFLNEVSRQFSADGMGGVSVKLLPNDDISANGYYR